MSARSENNTEGTKLHTSRSVEANGEVSLRKAVSYILLRNDTELISKCPYDKVHDAACTERQNERNKIREYKREYKKRSIRRLVYKALAA